MAKWNFNCQTCKKAKCYGYGMCFACDNSECNYEPFPPNTASSSTISIINNIPKEENQKVEELRQNIKNDLYKSLKG